MKIKNIDKKRYLLNDKRDYIILSKIYKLEKLELAQEDKRLVIFIKTQLKNDWRKPIIKILDKLLKKYNN